MKALSRTLSCCIFLLLFAILLLSTLLSVSAEDIQSNEAATCNNDDGNSCQEQSNKANNNRQPIREDMPISVTFRNESPTRADIYYDDGRFGKVVGSLNENGGEINISTVPNHRFFVTIHGTREPLVDLSDVNTSLQLLMKRRVKSLYYQQQLHHQERYVKIVIRFVSVKQLVGNARTIPVG